MQAHSKAILCLVKESEDFEAVGAYDEAAQKGRETTELLTVHVMSYTDFFCVTLGDALRAITVGTSQRTYFGVCFSCLNLVRRKSCVSKCASLDLKVR